MNQVITSVFCGFHPLSHFFHPQSSGLGITGWFVKACAHVYPPCSSDALIFLYFLDKSSCLALLISVKTLVLWYKRTTNLSIMVTDVFTSLIDTANDVNLPSILVGSGKISQISQVFFFPLPAKNHRASNLS